MHYYNNAVGIIIVHNNNSLTKNIKVGIKTYQYLICLSPRLWKFGIFW